MTEEWDDYGGEDNVLPTLGKGPSITDKVIQTDPTKKNSSYTFKT
jgi:hypothetical protein